MAPTPLLLTLGDPDGLGPELVCRLLGGPAALSGAPLLLLGPESALDAAVRAAGQGRFWTRVEDVAQASGPGVHLLVPPGLEDFRPAPGKARPEGGRAAGLALDAACALLAAGRAAGVVTCPLHKAMLAAAGFDFPGHTEFLAERLGVGREGVCMHLCGPKLRVSLVTTHPPLADAPRLVTRERVLRCLHLTADLLRRQGIPGPVAVCGLNPHAGEGGTIGREEIEVIAPAVEQARAAGLDVAGPLPADSLFHFAARGKYAAVLAMYHDQGLGPLKLLHFGEAVNVTLGLGVVRASPDHGTGHDLVGTGRASAASLQAALDLALRLLAAP
jgi:4-hydroxythreonine-4-phosphate dehydrogenase